MEFNRSKMFFMGSCAAALLLVSTSSAFADSLSAADIAKNIIQLMASSKVRDTPVSGAQKTIPCVSNMVIARRTVGLSLSMVRL